MGATPWSSTGWTSTSWTSWQRRRPGAGRRPGGCGPGGCRCRGSALARGPLLPDEDGEWVEAERAAVGTVGRVRRLAVDAAVAAGDHDGAAAVAEQALADDPYDEVVLRALMHAHLAARRPASALAAYARVRERLGEELGVPPTAETEALHARALAAADGDAVPAPTLRREAPVGVVGRAGELAALDAALAEAAAGGLALVVVEGDAGIGKTTLVDGWSRRVERRRRRAAGSLRRARPGPAAAAGDRRPRRASPRDRWPSGPRP